MSAKMILIGKIIGTYGVAGFVKVYPYSDFLNRCYNLKIVYLKQYVDSPEPGNKNKIEKAHVHNNLWSIKFKEVSTKEEAKKIRGFYMFITPEERLSLPQGHYYYDEIIGLRVFTNRGTLLGRVCDIFQTGSNDVYVVRPFSLPKDSEKYQKEILIPAIKEIVKEINIKKEFIIIKPLENLI